MLGLAGYASGELDRAVAGYRQALALEPRRPYLWHELARLYVDLERPAEAQAGFARCVEQLPGVEWPAVHATWAWLVREPRPGPVPPALERLPEDGSVAEWALLRAMAGLPLDAAPLQRALDGMAARGSVLTPSPWFVFQGSHRRLDLATVQALLGQRTQAETNLAEVQAQLDVLERQGNRWPALHFHRARVLALRGRRAAALDALEAAAAEGWRRAWWHERDPAFAELRAETRFVALQRELRSRVAAQRSRLGY
jgi:tetratricopeptide (TPR) repeat protein